MVGDRNATANLRGKNLKALECLRSQLRRRPVHVYVLLDVLHTLEGQTYVPANVALPSAARCSLLLLLLRLVGRGAAGRAGGRTARVVYRYCTGIAILIAWDPSPFKNGGMSAKDFAIINNRTRHQAYTIFI